MVVKKSDVVILDEAGLKKYQSEILNIAKDLIDVCKRNDIAYSLSGGSVIGAVRHQGLIPWDDDIDINIPRSSYNKLLKIFNNELGDKYYLQTPLNHPDLGIMVTQLRKKGTIARRKYDWNTNPCGISIDIYVVENVFDNLFKRKLQQLLSISMSFVVSSIRTFHNRNIPKEIAELEAKPVKLSGFKLTIGRVFRIIALKQWMRWLDVINSWCTDEESKYVTIPTGRRHFNGEMQKREDLLQYVEVPFEDINVDIPKNYDKYLTTLYGPNYMQVPPTSKRESHVFLELKY